MSTIVWRVRGLQVLNLPPLPAGLFIANIRHDDWYPTLNGGDECDFDTDIEIEPVGRVNWRGT
jgi:hypothetical protein